MTSATARANAARRKAPVVMIATPVYATTFPSFTHSLIHTIGLLKESGIEAGWLWSSGNSLICAARNELAARCLGQPKATHILWVDSDVSWAPKDVLRLLHHDVDVAVGLCPYKTFDRAPGQQLAFCRLRTDSEMPPIDREKGLLEIAGAGLGFMLTKRVVYERLIEAYPESSISTPDRALRLKHPEALPFLHNLFPMLVENGIVVGEDIAFCNRWRQIGGKIWADPTIQLSHHGHHAYTYDPMRMFKFERSSDRAA